MNIKFLTFIRKLKRKITLFLFNLRRRDNLRIGIFRGTPYEMGFSHGKIFKKQIKYTYNKHNKFYKFKNLNKHKISKLVNFIENKFPEFIEEMKGIADGSDMNKEDIIFLNLFPVINSIISRSKCTSVGFISNDKGPILGQNVDLGLEWRYYFIKKISPKNGYRSISGSWFGTIWQTVGMNEYGLCIGGSSVNVKKSHYDEIEDIILSNTVPLHFLSSLILSQCKNVEEAISLLNKYRFTLPFVVGESALLLDIEGKLAVIEKGGAANYKKSPIVIYYQYLYRF